MVIAIASSCLAVDVPTRSVRLALGSVAPTIVRAPAAEAFAADAVDWDASGVTRRRGGPLRRARRRRQQPDRRPPGDGGVPPPRRRGPRPTPAAAGLPRDPATARGVSEQYRAARQRRPAGRHRRLDRRVAAVRAARAARAARRQGRLRAGRVRVVQRAARRRAGLLVPGPGGQRRRPADRHHRGPRRAGRTDRRAAGVRRRRRRAVRVLHAGAGDGRPRPARAHARSPRSPRSASSCRATSAAAPATAG